MHWLPSREELEQLFFFFSFILGFSVICCSLELLFVFLVAGLQQ